MRAKSGMHKLTQFLFFDQWQHLRDACHARQSQIMGDMPIFVAHDSADVWARPELFRLDADGRPTVVAGVPPDYFSATGQLWGNPHYDWDVLAATGYTWWIERFRALLTLVDRVRLDHFRGFAASWEVPGDATTAMNGTVGARGPARRCSRRCNRPADSISLPFVAENLGVITPEVEALRQRFGLPGMAILQFAFGSDPQAPDSGRTTIPATWWSTPAPTTTTRRSAGGRRRGPQHAHRRGPGGARVRHAYLASTPRRREVHWEFIRAALASVADTAIVPAQDLLGLGSEARMNRPGTATATGDGDSCRDS